MSNIAGVAALFGLMFFLIGLLFYGLREIDKMYE